MLTAQEIEQGIIVEGWKKITLQLVESMGFLLVRMISFQT